MKYVSSGEGRMPLISLIAILSISLTINLPGLAVSPMLSKLHHMFHTSEMESQMLTSLPNLFMIPAILISGKIATASRQTAVLAIGLSMFLAGGIACFFADSMWLLIVLGCVVGIGCGLVVPIAAGCISEWFMGHSRQLDLGLKSTVSNSMVIAANLYVGWVVARSWHAAFVVYLLPVIPLLLLPFMTQSYIKARRILPAASTASAAPSSANATQAGHFSGRASLRMLIALIVLYLLLTYSTTSISYYSPFLMDHYGMSTSQVGIVTAMYYLMCAVAGAILGRLKRIAGKNVMFISLGLCAAGLITIGLTHSFAIYIIASLVTGLGYGIIQPIIYNKTTYVAPTRKLGTRYFGYVLSANYAAIMMVPFVDGFFKSLFHSDSPGFEFTFSGFVVILLLVWALTQRKYYVFAVNPDSAAPSPEMIAQSEMENKS